MLLELAVGILGAQELEPLDLFDESLHHGFQVLHVPVNLRARLQRVGDERYALLERGQNVGARDLLDLGAQGMHLVGEAGECVVRGDVGHDAAQARDCVLEMLEGGRILGDGSDAVDLLRHRAHGRFEADEALGRGERTQRVTHLEECELNARKVGGIRAGVALVVDPLRERPHLGLQGLDGVARHRLPDHLADLGQVVTQGVDGRIDDAGLERFDLGVDAAQLLLERA